MDSILGKISNDGFAVIPQMLMDDEIAEITEELNRSNLPRSRAGIRHAMRNASVASFSRHPQLIHLAEEVLGKGALPFRATLFDKSPNSNWLVVWHQDTALPLQERKDMPGWGPWSLKDGVNYAHAPARALEKVLALRVHLDDSTAHNGPLRVLPRTHTLDVLSDNEIHHLSDRVEPADCLVPRGGVLAMRPLVVHASSKSVSDLPRRVLHIEYASSQDSSEGLRLAIA